MKFFSLGPVQMYRRTKRVASKQVPYFRTDEFSSLMLENERLLKKALGATQRDKIVFLTASGTAAMEATVFNCFNSNDKLLVINGGTFGHRFTEICKHYGIPFEEIKLDFGVTLTQKMLEPFECKGFTALLVNIHETSTGQLYNKQMLSEFCKRNGMYFIVDAISSFIADELNMGDCSIDALILSSQKGLALAPGMSFVVISERLYTQRVENTTSPSLYFDFKDYIKNGIRGQTPYTPAVRIAYELNDMLRYIKKISIAKKLEQSEQLALDFRQKLSGVKGVEVPSYPLSNALTPIVFKNENAYDVYNYIKENHKIVLTPNGGELKDIVLRVGHIGKHTKRENTLVVKALKKALKEVGKKGN